MMQEEYARVFLTNKYQDLHERMLQIERDRHHIAQALSADSAEQAIELENDEVLDRLAEVTSHELAQVRRALDHFNIGQYGHCSVCGEEISYARLSALPEATECLACAERSEAGSA